MLVEDRLATARAGAADELVGLFPVLRKRLQADMPHDETGERCITPHQAEVLYRLGTAPAGGLTMNELARMLDCALSTATAMVDRLLRLDLAQRVHDEADRRVVRITLTDAGRDLTGRYSAAKHAVLRRALDLLTDDEVTTLMGLLRKMRTALEAEGGDAA